MAITLQESTEIADLSWPFDFASEKERAIVSLIFRCMDVTDTEGSIRASKRRKLATTIWSPPATPSKARAKRQSRRRTDLPRLASASKNGTSATGASEDEASIRYDDDNTHAALSTKASASGKRTPQSKTSTSRQDPVDASLQKSQISSRRTVNGSPSSSSPHRLRTKLLPATLARLAQGRKLGENAASELDGIDSLSGSQLSNGIGPAGTSTNTLGHEKPRGGRSSGASKTAAPDARNQPGDKDAQPRPRNGINLRNVQRTSPENNIKSPTARFGIINGDDPAKSESGLTQRKRTPLLKPSKHGVESPTGQEQNFVGKTRLKKYKGYVYVPVEDDEEDAMSEARNYESASDERPRPARTRRKAVLNRSSPSLSSNVAHRSPKPPASPASDHQTSIQRRVGRDNKASSSRLRSQREVSPVTAAFPSDPFVEDTSHTITQASRDAAMDGLVASREELSPAMDMPGSESLHHDLDPPRGPLLYETDSQSATELSKLMAEAPAEQITRLKGSILSVLTGRGQLAPSGLTTQYDKLTNLLRQTITAGEGNSMLILGPRGSGKSTLVQHAINKVASEHQDAFLVIKLSGFVCADDKIALRDIWRQLGHELEETVSDSDDGPRSINYADALTRLLALLNHTESSQETVGKADGDKELKSMKAIIFILDEFQLFASHPRQTLLYNLFDCAQSSTAPIAVLGLSTKLDAAEMLEKRVKSRFSQRQLLVTVPRTFIGFKDICLAALTPKDLDNGQSGFALRLSRAHGRKNGEQPYETLKSSWIRYLYESLFDSKCDPVFSGHLQRLYAYPSSVPAFYASALFPVHALSTDCIPTGVDFVSSALSSSNAITQTLLPPENKLSLLSSLSTLELSLIICAARMEIILDQGTMAASDRSVACTFDMAYGEYLDLASRSKVINNASPFSTSNAVSASGRIFSRSVSKGAWENLCHIGLLVPASAAIRSSSASTPAAGNGSTWRVEVALEEVGVIVGTGAGWGAVGSTLARWCRDL